MLSLSLFHHVLIISDRATNTRKNLKRREAEKRHFCWQYGYLWEKSVSLAQLLELKGKVSEVTMCKFNI